MLYLLVDTFLVVIPIVIGPVPYERASFLET
jgi:hypothetical protein